MTTKVLEQPEELSWAAFRGRDVSFIFSEMLVLMCPSKPCGWRWRQTYGPCSMRQIERSQRSSCKQPSRSTLSQHPDCLPGWRKTFQKGLRSSLILLSIENPSGQPIAWNGSTRKFEEGQEW